MKRHASPVPNADLWADKIRLALDSDAWSGLLPLPIDGLVLVESRSIEDVSHEVHLHQHKIRRCTGDCGMHPACFHRAAVFIALRVETAGEDELAFIRWQLDTSANRVRLHGLIDLHCTKPRKRHGSADQWWLHSSDVPETRNTLPDPVGEFMPKARVAV